MDSRRQNQPNNIRLQKYLAQCGIGSRRACEEYIRQGLVCVGGRIIQEQGVRVDPSQQEITYKGSPVHPEEIIYILLNKPKDVLCTSHDPSGRRTFMSLLPSIRSRVYTVGRLDRDSEGLLLVTNDGDLAVQLTHPRHHVPKVYRVWTEHELSNEDRQLFVSGIRDKEDILKAASVERIPVRGRGPGCYEVKLLEGKNRQLRRMFDAVGVPVMRLKRMSIGPLKLEGLRPGKWRYLTDAELDGLKSAAAV